MVWVPARNCMGYFYLNDLNEKFQTSTNDYCSGSFFLAYGKIYVSLTNFQKEIMNQVVNLFFHLSNVLNNHFKK